MRDRPLSNGGRCRRAAPGRAKCEGPAGDVAEDEQEFRRVEPAHSSSSGATSRRAAWIVDSSSRIANGTSGSESQIRLSVVHSA